jgi:hypothetical protein
MALWFVPVHIFSPTMRPHLPLARPSQLLRSWCRPLQALVVFPCREVPLPEITTPLGSCSTETIEDKALSVAVQPNPTSQHENENERQCYSHDDPRIIPVNAI